MGWRYVVIMKREEELVAEGLVRVAQAAEFSGLSRSKLYELMEAGGLAYVKIGRARRIPRHALIDLAARNLTGGGWRAERR